MHEVVEAAGVKYRVPDGCYVKASQVPIDLYEFVQTNDLVQPMSRECKAIPEQDEPQKQFKRRPPRTIDAMLIDLSNKTDNPDHKKDMAYLMRNKALCPAVCLNCPCRWGRNT